MKADVDLSQLKKRDKQTAELRVEVERLRRALELAAHKTRNYEVPVRARDNVIRFGLFSDTQIGSQYERVDALNCFLDILDREGITDGYHAGDVFDGHGIYKGQTFELYAVGFDEQLKAFQKRVKYHKNVKVRFITGNHDASFKKLCGVRAGPALQEKRGDWEFLGEDYASVTMIAACGLRYRMDLLHPGGGTAYALSYHPQKIIESLPGGQKPAAIAIGHYHKAEWIPGYRNVHGFQAGCFQSQTPFMAGRHIAAMMGGWIISVALVDRKRLTTRTSAEFIAFMDPEK